MKKPIVLVLAVILLSAAAPVFAQPTDLEMEQAFTLSFQVFFLASIQTAFGMVIPGVEVDDEGMVLTDVDLAAMELEELGPYSSISGTILAVSDTEMHADLKLTGGPVKKLGWKIAEFNMEEDFTVTITADGRTRTVNTADMQME